ncbi:MAG: hypothetical protein UV80_C0010G0017 [Candidatus Peregrinibacteria bacterium GW2011_GWF2_43_17]|nr:MAG: hypothetical protein UV80_C0010G0017 [Candidatus Peregrinibacteria bacterium GW2011_GWF2_43_17]
MRSYALFLYTMETTQPKERLIPPGEYAELRRAFVDCKTARLGITEKHDRLKEIVDRVLGDDNEKLLELYERLCQDAMTELKEVLTLPFWRQVFDRIVESNGIIDGQTFGGIERDGTEIGKLINAGNMIQAMGFDRPKQALSKSPLGYPFEKIDVDEPRWASKLKIAENFLHSFSHLIDIHGLAFLVDTKSRHEVVYMLSQAKAIGYTCELLDAYSRQISSETIEKDVSMAEVLRANRLLYEARFLGESMYAALAQTGMPVEVITIGDAILRNADMGKIIGAIKEPMANTARPGKIEPEELARLAEARKPYVTILTEEVVLRGERFVKVEIVDRGAQIDLNRIKDDVGMGDFEFRDANVRDLLDYLSQRHRSVPLKTGGYLSSGIGLHTTRETISEYGGEIYYTNMRGQGVRCMILIPVDGAKSKIKLSEEKITGKELDSIAIKIDGATTCRDFEAGDAEIRKLFGGGTDVEKARDRLRAVMPILGLPKVGIVRQCRQAETRV